MLIDLLVTLGIMVLLFTISIPYLKRYQPNLELNGVARKLTADLRYAQQLTVTEQIVHKVSLDINNDSYSVLKIGIATTTVKEVVFPANVNIQEITGLTSNTVVFNSYGGVSQSGQIILINTNNKTSEINIKPSGYVQLSE